MHRILPGPVYQLGQVPACFVQRAIGPVAQSVLRPRGAPRLVSVGLPVWPCFRLEAP